VNILEESQPLLNPTHICTDISMDFIVGLIKMGNKLVFMVVVDYLSRATHFCSLAHPFTTFLISQVLLKGCTSNQHSSKRIHCDMQT
jgi:hypothetical protein